VEVEKENDATRAGARFMQRGYVGDRKGATSWIAPDSVAHDHRRLGGGTAEGREAFLEAGMAHQDVGFTKWSATPLQVRGNSLALVRLEQASESGFTLTYLVVMRSDSERRLAEIAIFDEEDIERAVEELDGLHAAHGDSPSTS
jgi:hypothetical protein